MLFFKQARNAKGLKQTQAAEYLGVSRQVYNNYELGKRQADYETLLKLAELFDTTVEYLLTGRRYTETIGGEPSEIKKSPSVPERTKDEWRNVISELSEDEVRELWTFVHFLRYRRIHSDFREE